MTVIKEEIRSQIIDASRIIFSKYGFKKTTMDDIAKAMHKGKSSIYYYFKSKEEIFEAVVEQEAVQFRKELAAAIADTGKPSEKLRAYITIRMNGFKRMANFYEAIKNDFLGHLDFINKIRAKYDENEINSLASILQEGVDKEEFVLGDIKLTAIAIFTAIKGLEIPLFWTSENTYLDSHLDSVISVLFNGILKH